MELTMKELIESKWQEILNILVKEHEISEVAVNTWIQPLTIQTISDDSITFFMVRGPRGIEFIKHKYYEYAGTPSELPAEGRLAAEIIALIARSDIEAERDAYCSNGNTFVFRKAEEQVDGPWTIAPGLTVN